MRLTNDENDDTIGPLTGPAEIDRAIDGNEVSLCRAEAVVLFKDTLEGLCAAHDLAPSDFVFDNPIPVFGIDWDKSSVVGSAVVHWEGDRMIAKVILAYDTPERLILQNGEKLFAETVFFGTPGTPVRLREFFLSRHEPVDSRETPLHVME